MTCDDFLPALETGGWLRRAAARRHAAGCPACARTLAAWQALKRDLADAPLLSARQRALWTSAARSGAVRPRARGMRRAVDFAIAAALLLLATYLVVLGRRGREQKAVDQPRPTSDIVVVAISPASIAAEVSPLEQRLARLEIELAALSRRAELADLRQQVAALLDEYRHW
jgi:hypothetical protein